MEARQVTMLVSVIVNGVIVLAISGAVLTRRKFYPLSRRSPLALLTLCLVPLAFFAWSLLEAFGLLPCGLFNHVNWFLLALYGDVIAMTALRVWILQGATKARLEADVDSWFLSHRHYADDSFRYRLLGGALLLRTALFLGITLAVDFDTFTSSSTDCDAARTLIVALYLALMLIYLLLGFFFLSRFRRLGRMRDGVKIRRDLRWMVWIWVIQTILWGIPTLSEEAGDVIGGSVVVCYALAASLVATAGRSAFETRKDESLRAALMPGLKADDGASVASPRRDSGATALQASGTSTNAGAGSTSDLTASTSGGGPDAPSAADLVSEHTFDERMFAKRGQPIAQLDIILASAKRKGLLREFLAGEYSVENLQFIDDVDQFVVMVGSTDTVENAEVLAEARRIYAVYIANSAPSQINLNAKDQKSVEAALTDAAMKSLDDADQRLSPDFFAVAYRSIKNLVATDSMHRFLNSDLYLKATTS